MKPKLLTMSAFGSYGGVTQIDFERAGTGLFLITGDTGASQPVCIGGRGDLGGTDV